MASKQSDALKVLYRSWIDALSANPEMPLDELRRMFEHWGDVTAEPGGVRLSRNRPGRRARDMGGTESRPRRVTCASRPR
jgi:hypothetical protein